MSKPKGTKNHPMNYAIDYAIAASCQHMKLSPDTQQKLAALRERKKIKPAA